MTNYQLYRTNVLLGGQMKYDIIIDNKKGNLFVNDFHITPISRAVSYNKYIVDNLMNYSHQENIKRFYHTISSSFYKDYTNPQLTSLYPLPNEFDKETSETTYEMGCRRMERYQLYGKQFEFFCPIWLEQIENMSQIKFVFQISSKNGKPDPITTKTLSFDILEDSPSNHTKFIEYMNNYIEYIKLKNGCDWVFDINKKNCVVGGLNVNNGLVSEVKLLNFFDDLTYRERPLLEFNNMIINELNKNKLITKQLFNFNFCFNLEDLLQSFLFEEMNKYPLRINIKVLIDDVELKVMDIYSNHEYIPKTDIALRELRRDGKIISINHKENDLNVLDYLQDNKCIDLIDKNKIIQNTCHWCLSNNPSEHFNVYNGFSPVNISPSPINDSVDILDIPYYNGDTANLTVQHFNKTCNSYWCDNYLVSESQIPFFIIDSIIRRDFRYDDLFTKFTNNCYIKNINYVYKPDTSEYNFDFEINVCILRTQSDENNYLYTNTIKKCHDLILDFENWDEVEIIEGNKKICTFYIPNPTIPQSSIQETKYLKSYIIIIFNNEESNQDKLLYTEFIEIIKAVERRVKGSHDDVNVLSIFLKVLDNYKLTQQNFIFNNGIIGKKCNGPSIDSEEITYYKTSSNVILIRNFGKIKPFFIKDEDRVLQNYKWKKFKYNEIPNQIDYEKFSQTIYQPKYPSKNYFAFGYNNEEYYAKSEDLNSLEYHRFIDNKILYLYPSLIYNLEQSDLSYNDIKNEVKNHIDTIYKHLNLTDKQKNYIYSKYEFVIKQKDNYVQIKLI